MVGTLERGSHSQTSPSPVSDDFMNVFAKICMTEFLFISDFFKKSKY